MRHHEFKNGDRMPVLGLGTWKAAPGEVGRAIEEAVRIGYRHFDCASIYGNEAEIGDALQRVFKEGAVERDDLWITSKLWCNRHEAGDVGPAIEETLAHLQCEYLDLYLVHWPVALKHDVKSVASGDDFLSLDEVPLLETWGAMEGVLERGLARHIGVSNYSASKIGAHAGASVFPEVNQVEMHPYLRQQGLVDYGAENGVFITAYSPLGSKDRPEGMRSADDPVLLEDEVVAKVAARVGATPAQVLLAWAMQRGTSAIPKSVDPGRMAENFAAASIELDAEAMGDIDGLDRSRRYVTGSFWALPGSGYSVEDLWA